MITILEELGLHRARAETSHDDNGWSCSVHYDLWHVMHRQRMVDMKIEELVQILHFKPSL